MKPLKVAFLWHMHQPNYELNGKYILPWVRLHAIKDYLDFPSMLYKYPNVKFNFNYVPVLLDQLENISNQNIIDDVFKLSTIDPKDLTAFQKDKIINDFFTANYENMIAPYPHYNYLHGKAKKGESFSDQEILDLQVWYNLCWTGILTKNNIFYERLIQKRSGYNIQERDLLLKKQINLIKQINPNLSDLINLGQLELSLSPYNHPILPLLCDINSAKQMLRELKTENIDLQRCEDAKFQIDSATEKYESLFGGKLKGMWPSEGSLSNEVLDLVIGSDIGWAASDEQMLRNSDPNFKDLEKYFPRKYESEKGEITLFFRDNRLSDKIGFTYTNWDAQKAVDDLFFDLHDIRNRIISEYGEFALDHACVSIILDGENCWEFYKNLGLDFRNTLMSRLNDDEYFHSVTFAEASKNNSFLFPINSVKAGSWINGNFEVWIGEKIHLKAWQMLAKVRKLIAEKSDSLTADKYKSAMDYIYKAESSDWFWWYFSKHWAPNKADFDVLFRYNLKSALEIAEIKIPDEVLSPVWSEQELEEMRSITGRTNAMHQVSFE